MRSRLLALFRKEIRQITRSKRTVGAALLAPAILLLFVTSGDILTVKIGFGSKPIYLLSTAHPLAGKYLIEHFSLPVLVSISALVTPSIVMGDVLLGERERRTLELLVGLPVSAFDIVLAKLGAVLLFAVGTIVPLFILNTLLVTALGYGSATQTALLLELLLAAVCYSAGSSLLVALLAGEPRAANIVSGLVLGPVVPFEGVVLAGVTGHAGILVCAIGLLALACLVLAWSWRLLSFERLFGNT